MKLLLDTNAVLAVLGDAVAVSPRIEELLSDDDNEKLISVVSFWEMTIKVSLGKLQMARSPAIVMLEVETMEIATVLPINADHLGSLHFLPQHHRDPFDRMIVAQALSENCPLISSDVKLDVYGITRLW